MKLRITYEISGNLRFISHKDILRMLGRLFRQVDFPLAYSQGFSPHPLLSFSHARAVGVASLAEIVDVGLSEEVALPEIISRINDAAPSGFVVRGAKMIDANDFKLKEISRAEYTIYNDDINLSEDEFLQKMQASEVVIKKYSSKKGTVEVDVRDFVFEGTYISPHEVKIVLKVGERNVSPIAFSEYLFGSRKAALSSIITRNSFIV